MGFESFHQNEGHEHTDVVSEEKLAVMQKVAEEFGVSINVIARAGEEYTRVGSIEVEEVEEETVFTGHVPEGQVYISISSSKRDLSDFWTALRGE